MRLHDELLAIEGAPAAGESVAMLHEVDGPLEFGGPAGGCNLTPALVDEY